MIPQPYPDWICLDCGQRLGNRPTTGELATWHEDTCGVCYRLAPCTEPRDFGHLRNGWRDNNQGENDA